MDITEHMIDLTSEDYFIKLKSYAPLWTNNNRRQINNRNSLQIFAHTGTPPGWMMACSLHLSLPSPWFLIVVHMFLVALCAFTLHEKQQCLGGNHLFCLTWWKNPHIINQTDDPAFSDEPV